MQQKQKRYEYINFKKIGVSYDLENHTFDVMVDGMGCLVKNAKITSLAEKTGKTFSLDHLRLSEVKRLGAAQIFGGQDNAALQIRYDHLELNRQPVYLTLCADDSGFACYFGGDGTMKVVLEGEAYLGDCDQSEIMAMAINRPGTDLRCASGPATSEADNALFDPYTDTAIEFETLGRFRFRYDWNSGGYRFVYETPDNDFSRFLKLRVRKNVYQTVFNFDYKKMNPDTVFKTPPVGWMTWYAVQFEAGEKTVLENAKWQADYLKEYGADTVWVDWEWYHRNFMGVCHEHVDMFHPDPKAYPNGLKYVADEIKKLGFIPALWIGPTCDPNKNELIEKYPDAVMIQQPEWCGQYFLDPAHPAFVNEILPKMLNLVQEWGYEAVKWDCMPHTLYYCDQTHERRREAGMSSREAMITAFRKAREVLGDHCPMLYCCSLSQRDIDLACTMFDATRIGNDVFRWEEFLAECVDKLYKYYPLHNVVLMTDPDNVVLRERYNNYNQALTRAAIVSLLGLPFTFGDVLHELPADRIEIIRRSIPPIPQVHSSDIRTCGPNHKHLLINLGVERPFGHWNVVDVANLTGEAAIVEVDFYIDLHLDLQEGPYLVYDYWKKRFLGRYDRRMKLELNPYESAILSVCSEREHPIVISTSRHISHGAYDLIDVRWDGEKGTLSGRSLVVGGEPYSVVVTGTKNKCAPAWHCNYTDTLEVEGAGDNVWRVTFHPEKSGEFEWTIGFFDTVMQG